MTPYQVDFWAYMDALFRIVSGGYRDPSFGEDGKIYVTRNGGDRLTTEEAGLNYWQICSHCMDIAMGKVPGMEALSATLQDWIKDGEGYGADLQGDCESCGLPGDVRWFPARQQDLCLSCYMRLGR